MLRFSAGLIVPIQNAGPLLVVINNVEIAVAVEIRRMPAPGRLSASRNPRRLRLRRHEIFRTAFDSEKAAAPARNPHCLEYWRTVSSMCPLANREVERAIEIDVEKCAAEAERVARGKSNTGGDGNIVVDSWPRCAIQTDHLVVEFVMAIPGRPEFSKSAVSTPIPARALPSALNANPASTAASLNFPLPRLR